MQLPRSKVKFERRRKNIKNIFLVVLILFFVILSSFLYYAFSNKYQVSEIVLTGSSFIDKGDFEKKINSFLDKKLWGIIPLRSSYLINKKLITEDIYKSYSSVKSVSIDIRDRAVFFDIKEREAFAIICDQKKLCYFMDKTGFVFEESPKFEGSSFIKIENFISDIIIGQTTLGENELTNLEKIINLFESKNLTIKYIDFKSDNQVNLIGPNGMEFYLSRNDSVTNIEEKLKIIINSHPNISSGDFEYIDMRVNSKIFLKNR